LATRASRGGVFSLVVGSAEAQFQGNGVKIKKPAFVSQSIGEKFRKKVGARGGRNCKKEPQNILPTRTKGKNPGKGEKLAAVLRRSV